MTNESHWQRQQLVRNLLVAAAVVGTLHAIASIYWGFGGKFLLETLGSDLVRTLQSVRWALIPVGVVKIVAAIAPVVLNAHHWPIARLTRLVCWVGGVGLILWGGANTIVGNLVLSGVIKSTAGYDRPGMVGHAWLWDPLFLIWGIALVVAMRLSSAQHR